MDSTTRLALSAINRRFYSEHAERFSDSRENPWSGWERVLESIPPQGPGCRVLDVGCGNGRFARFLTERWPEGFDYQGIDASHELLALARDRCVAIPGLRFSHCDFVEADPDACLPAGPFELIVVFGVLHHVPGSAQRRTLLRALVDRLVPDGWLAFSVWRFSAFERFRKRLLPWEGYLANAPRAIALDQLEDGDHLLRFGEGDGSPRYCHFADDAEVESWRRDLPVEAAVNFDADRYNRYGLWRRTPAPAPTQARK